MLRIRVQSGDSSAYSVDLESTEEERKFLIGRAGNADVSIDDRYLSRRHATVFFQEGQWWIEDLGSRNGTLLNGRRMTDPQHIHPGDSIRLSDTVLTIENSKTGGTLSESAHSIFRPASELLAPARPAGETGSDDRLRVLNEIHRALALSIERDELLGMILERVFDLLQPSEGAILLLDEKGEHYRAAYKSVAKVDTHFWSETLANEVIHKGMAALVTDVEHDRRFAAAESILSSGVRTLVAAPLTDGEGTFGMIALTSDMRERPFREQDMELLVSLGNVAALRIRNILLTEEALRRRELEHELHLARKIQVRLLPEELPEVEGYEILGRNRPSRGVSGDYYYAAIHNERLVVMIADVSGKGISASLLTASLEALAAAPLEASSDPQAICTELSVRLFARTPAAKYATSLLAILDPSTGQLTYVNAGHNPGILIRRNGIELLETGGLPLGLAPEADYQTGTASLDIGETLALYTDGITEATNAADDDYAEERLHEVLHKNSESGLIQMADAVEEDVLAFVGEEPFADDRTLVLVRRTGSLA